ncbi:DUF4062 domain-containing protein [Methanobrevibacter millerae]|uniref:WD40 repeat n=1 Tax=Methanobrevibacter millerae TaxID=230361 RepID=A0A1G5VTQ3_9EURY|nr:DUF4062 domain-containing protein [Methanobrevibacter millerae]SDA49219.1 WD40 repeat [Methanobrevibacter millerae]
MEWKKATIFISSTFNDMHAERDYLIKEVFPELTEWCEERKIRLSDVDLRWGVKEEDSENNATVGTCLRHIDKSRPFFLCFLGQRRGWVPDFEKDINKETKDQYPTIKELDPDRSVTEMEIEHSLLSPLYRVLNEEDKLCPPTRHSLFFFRNPSYVDNLSPAQRLIYTNDNEKNIEHADEKLAEIKQRIRDKQSNESKENESRNDEEKIYVDVTDYEGTWDSDLELPELSHYENNEGRGRLTDFKCGDKSLKEVLLEQLKKQLEAEFPENMPVEDQTPLQKDLDQQEIFCYLNSEGFIPRPNYTGYLEDYVENSHENKICLVSAEAGYGKTMLLAKFATDFEEKDNGIKLYKRFCGASDLSSQTYSLWKSIIDEAGISEDEEFYPNNLDELKRKIPEILNTIASKGKSLIIIDAVNQMPNGMDMLKWLGHLPENLKIIISIKEDKNDEKYNDNLDKIKARNNICHFEIKELDDDGKRDLIKEYLKNYLKALDDAEIDTICDFPASKNPLFLKILLAELRVFGSFDQLKDKITMFGDSPKSAFDHVLERLEEDEQKGENIVPLIFSLLANARVGLSEDEIVSIIETQTDIGKKEIQDVVRLNLRQVRPFMARKEGRHDFFYESFKLAAQERYADKKIDRNASLASYFMAKADPGEDYSFDVEGENENEKLRPLNELPYHLDESKNTDELSKVLSSFAFIKNKMNLSDVYNLISDYQFDDEHKFITSQEDHPIVLIGRALELSAPVLDNNKDQLSAQLWGRMCDIDDDIIKGLLAELDSKTDDDWLKSNNAALYSPKSSIIKRIKPEGKESSSFISISEDKKLMLANEDGVLNIFDVNLNDLDTFREDDPRIIKIILNDDGYTMLVAYSNGEIKELDYNNKIITKEYPKIDAEITDIYLSKTYNKIYASSHNGVFSIDLDTNELKKEDIEAKNYNQILVPRRNEAILVCDEREVDGWDVYEMRKAYNKQHQQNEEEESGTKLDSSEEIRFMGLNKRFLTLISENGQMKFWNTLKNSGGGESIAEEHVCSPNDKFTQAITLEDENEIITISDMGVMRVWDIPQPRSPTFDRLIDIQTGIKSPTAIDYYTDGTDRWVIVGNENNDINVIDLNKKVEANEETKHSESVLSVKIDDNRMITASDNGEIFTWDFDNEEFKNKYTNDFRCNSISFNREDSKLVLAGVKAEKDGRKTYKIATCTVSDGMWGANDAESIELESEETTNSKEIIDIAQNNSGIVFIEEDKLSLGGSETKFDKTATTLATKFDSDDAYVGFEDGSIVRYPSGETFSEISSQVTKIKVSEGKVIAGYENGSIEILDLDLGSHEHLDAHDKAVTNFYVDDTQLISLGKDNTIKFWDIGSKECKYTYYLDIFATSISLKDGKLVVGDTLGNVRFFNFENY